MTALLQRFPHRRQVHLFGHGAPGQLWIGNTSLTALNLQHYSPLLGSGFYHSATLALYGCQVAAGTIGRTFLSALYKITKANIMAASTVVGNAAQGGHWVLDTVLGEPVPLAIAPHAQRDYPHTLNSAPVARDETYTLRGNQPLNVPSREGVLLNDSDADGDRLRIEAGTFETRHCGSVVLNVDGGFSYTGRAPHRGIDSFDYTLTDGNGGTDIGTVTILLNPDADTDGDGVADADDRDTDNDGIPDTVEQEGDPHRDTDGDCLVDWLDPDSDGDGIFDLVEAGYGDRDADGDGVLDGVAASFGSNGLLYALETVPDSDVTTGALPDTGGAADEVQDPDADNGNDLLAVEDELDTVDEVQDPDADNGSGQDGNGIEADGGDSTTDAIAPDGGDSPITEPDSDTQSEIQDRDSNNDNDFVPQGDGSLEDTGGTSGGDGTVDAPALETSPPTISSEGLEPDNLTADSPNDAAIADAEGNGVDSEEPGPAASPEIPLIDDSASDTVSDGMNGVEDREAASSGDPNSDVVEAANPDSDDSAPGSDAPEAANRDSGSAPPGSDSIGGGTTGNGPGIDSSITGDRPDSAASISGSTTTDAATGSEAAASSDEVVADEGATGSTVEMSSAEAGDTEADTSGSGDTATDREPATGLNDVVSDGVMLDEPSQGPANG